MTYNKQDPVAANGDLIVASKTKDFFSFRTSSQYLLYNSTGTIVSNIDATIIFPGAPAVSWEQTLVFTGIHSFLIDIKDLMGNSLCFQTLKDIRTKCENFPDSFTMVPIGDLLFVNYRS